MENMRRLSFQINVVIFTCFILITFAATNSFSQSDSKKTSLSNQFNTQAQAIRIHPKGWKKITVSKRVSFYLPSKLKKTGLPGNEGVVKAYKRFVSNGFDFYLYYAYGERVPSDLNPSQGQTNQILISGKRASINIWEGEDRNGVTQNDFPGMKLIISDFGEGANKFEIYMVGSDSKLMKQIIDSVKIH
jgi:hypothetical protein